MSPEEAAFSKAAPADAVFTVVADSPVTLSALKNAAATVNSSNYTYSSGVLTIKKEYLGTLSNGEKIFTLVMSSGDSLTVKVTVGD